MLSPLRAACGAVFLAMFGAALASAQTIDFTLFVTVNDSLGTSTGTVSNNSTVPIEGQVGTQATATVVATYTGSTQATITSLTIIGSTALTESIPNKGTLPVTVGTGQSLTFVVTYAPTNANIANAQVEVQYTEPGTTTATVSNAILLEFQGVAPSFALNYFITPANSATPNYLPLASGGTVTFPATPLNTTVTGGLQIENLGSGPGEIIGISLSQAGSAFQLSGTPAATPTQPFAIAAGDGLQIGILYTPVAVGQNTATITITYQGGATATVNLTGTGATSLFTYSYIPGGSTTPIPVSPNGTIVLTPVAVTTTAGTTPATSNAIVQVKNTGAATGTITSITLSGPFSFLTQPTTFTLAPGATLSFTIVYTPTAVGTQTGTLVVGSDVFTLSSQGLGSQLTFSYSAAGTTIPVGTGAAVSFPPIAVSKSESITFTITNSGTGASSTAIISLIAAAGTTSATATAFSATPPPLPLSLAAGKSVSFAITFTPPATGPISGTLLVNNTQIPLIGSGNAPPALPSYTLSGPSGTVSPASQAAVSLTLASPYAVDIDGVLTLTTSGSFGTDPNVQFSTGSSTGNRTVDFVIPAGSTSANFAGQGSQIFVQTGTVAETVILTPTFATDAGVDLTPTSPPTLQFTIPQSAPVLNSIQLIDETSSSFTVVLTGYSTTRSLGTLTIAFTAASGYKLPTSQFSTDIGAEASAWFLSTTAQSYGGQFEVAVPINLSGSVPNGQVLIDSLASVTATVANSVGTSGSLTSPVP